MINLTITVDEETLRKAEQRAHREGSSVDRVLRNYLESHANPATEQQAAARNFLTIAKESKSGHVGRGWTRDELYDRRVLRQR